MCRFDTRVLGLACWLGLAVAAPAQTAHEQRWDWRPLGVPLLELDLPSPAAGPVERVWYSEAGDRLYARTRSGKVYATEGERWRNAGNARPPSQRAELRLLGPAAGVVRVWRDPAGSPRLYALGRHLLRSDDDGRSWLNLTEYGGTSILGAPPRDLAVSPANPDLIVLANDFGVWRSADGGLSWTGMNESLPSLRVRRILAVPEGVAGLRIEVEGVGVFEWSPGERRAWRPGRDPVFESENRLRTLLSGVLEAEITAVAVGGDFIYAGSADGRLWVSRDRGNTWRLPEGIEPGGAVVRIWLDASQPELALAAVANPEQARLLRTTNGGLFWDDLTANLPRGARVFSAVADRASGAIYAATERGLFYTRAQVDVPGPATPWAPAPAGLPDAPVFDVRLDGGGNRIFVAVDGYGVYAATAPHCAWSPRVVHAADVSPREAAPGALLSVLGARVERAQAGALPAPVLSASESESQIQLPFEAAGDRIELALETQTRRLRFSWPLERVAPAIVLEPDGSPLLVDAETGLLLDAMNPARSGGRIQVLATGLGQVRPPWPAGLPAPLEGSPSVVATVRAFLDDVETQVLRAELAPGYAGLYVVEIRLPEVLDRGPAALHLEVDGKASNRVLVHLEP
ncbi:MAG: hypothetical protein RMI94_12190 [Bryobacterales bacterium]|nr:hypothetical protein [Bryobacteraceae bacterium]MDW8131305.1 hypothetical protein [Bryobacterales bacterium]